MLGTRSRRVALGVLLGALALLTAACQGGEQVQAGTGYVSGDGTVSSWPAGSRPGPVSIEGKDPTGAQLATSNERGHVIVLNFWQAACPPCRAEAADLVALAEQFAEQGVVFLGVNGTDDAATAQAFERTYHVPYSTILDTDSSATAALQGVVAVRAVPTTLVLDQSGHVAARILGRLDPATLKALISDTLAQRSDG